MRRARRLRDWSVSASGGSGVGCAEDGFDERGRGRGKLRGARGEEDEAGGVDPAARVFEGEERFAVLVPGAWRERRRVGLRKDIGSMRSSKCIAFLLGAGYGERACGLAGSAGTELL